MSCLRVSVVVKKQYDNGNFIFLFLRQNFSVAWELFLELALVYQAGLELRKICLPLPPEGGIKGVRHHHMTTTGTLIKENI